MTFLSKFSSCIHVVRCAILCFLASIILPLHGQAEVIELTASCDVEARRDQRGLCSIELRDRWPCMAGTKPVNQVLLTHGRRDVVWRARKAAESGEVVAPARERDLLENGVDYWGRFPQTRYHDYAQQTTKVPLPCLDREPTGSRAETLIRTFWNPV